MHESIICSLLHDLPDFPEVSDTLLEDCLRSLTGTLADTPLDLND